MLLLLFLLLQVGFHELCLLHVALCFLLMIFDELFLVIKHFFQEFLPTSSSTQLLTTSHLLLESIYRSSLFFVLGLNSGAFVKLTVY